MGNSVHALKLPSAAAEELDLSSTYRACTTCARLLFEDVRSGVRVSELSERIGTCPATISRIMNRDTKEPRWSTLFAILKYKGFRVLAVR